MSMVREREYEDHVQTTGGYTTCACSTAFTANLYHRRVRTRKMPFITGRDDRKTKGLLLLNLTGTR